MLNQDAEVGLRDALARMASEVPVPAGLTERVRSQGYKVEHSRKATAAFAVASLAVVATGAGAPLAFVMARGTSSPGTTVRLASFSMRLPHGYHEVAKPAPPCGAVLDYVTPSQSTPTSPPPLPNAVSQPRMVVSQPKIVTAVDEAGGCVFVAASSTFNPGAAVGPQIFPTLANILNTRSVQVDGYSGWAGSVDWAQVPGPHQLLVVPNGGSQPVPHAWPTGTEQVLDLTIPRGGGKVQDFTVAAKGISQSELVSIVTSGLTLPATPRTTTTSVAGD